MSQPAASPDPTTVLIPNSPQLADPNILIEDLTHNSPPGSIAAAQALLLEYGRFVESQSTVAGFCYGALEEEAASLPASYLSQQGGALLASRQTPPGPQIEGLGFVAWRTLPTPRLTGAYEIKRLWVRPEARGLQLGRMLMQSVIDRAQAAGKEQLLLDTVPAAMDRAYRLYLDMGFIETPSYNDHSIPGILYMRKQLKPKK